MNIARKESTAAPGIAAALLLAMTMLCQFPACTRAGTITIHAPDEATRTRVHQAIEDLNDNESSRTLKEISEVTFLGASDASSFQFAGVKCLNIDGSFANSCLVDPALHLDFFANGTLPAGNYLFIFRVQSTGTDAYPSCRMEIRDQQHRMHGAAYTNNFISGQWSTMSAKVVLDKPVDGLIYHFSAFNHTIAMDQFIVLQIGSSNVKTTPSGAKQSTTAPSPEATAPPAIVPTTAPIDVEVPAQPAGAKIVPVTPADPDAIERPEYQSAPKPLIKTLSSITSMMVTVSPDGEAHGVTSDIIATVDPESRLSGKAGIGIVRVDGDYMMKTALEEAVRAVRLRYPIWEPGHIDLSFGEKFVPHAGPSAGTAFGVLMLSVLEGFSIDPKCAVTGDITVDWKVRKVGGVTAKLHGATLDKCLYATIPEDNEAAFDDMACLYGHSAVWNIQAFSIATLQDAVAIARKDRAADLAQAIKLFAGLQPQLTKSEVATLHNPETVKTLNKILELAPNHLSAKYVLALSDGSASRTLSENGTLHQVSVIFHPYRTILVNRESLNRTTLPAYVTVLARKRLDALRPIANKELLPLVKDISALISTMDEFASGSASADTVVTRAQAVDARFAALGSDPDFAEHLVREGY